MLIALTRYHGRTKVYLNPAAIVRLAQSDGPRTIVYHFETDDIRAHVEIVETPEEVEKLIEEAAYKSEKNLAKARADFETEQRMNEVLK